MIEKLVRRMLIAQALSALTICMCALIDNIMIGRFLGVTALAADSIASPVLLAINAAATLLSAGVQVACGRSLGKGDQAELNENYSSVIVAAALFSIVFAVLAGALRMPLSVLLGARGAELADQTGGYILGFLIGTPAVMISLILMPFLQIAGQNRLLVAAVLGLTVSDVALDLLNVFVFHGGMFGMGLASSVSYYVALLISCTYFFSKKSIVRFSLAAVRRSKIRDFFAGGAPTVIDLVFGLAFVFLMNRLLIAAGGDRMVAVFSVVSSVGTTGKCVSVGASGVSLTLSGIFYYEESRTDLRRMLREMICASAVAGAAVTALLVLLASPLVRLYLPQAGAEQRMTVLALRCFALGLIPCCLNNVLKSCYQGTERVRRMESISLFENVLLPVAAAAVLLRAADGSGVWLYFLFGEALALLGVMASIWLKKRRVTWAAEDALLLRDGFGVPPEDLLERNVRSLPDAMDVSRAAEDFCRAHGGSEPLASQLALCVEEMATNVVAHGFAPDIQNSLSVLLQCKDGLWTLRFRDDCRPFDPVRHLSEHDGTEAVGIRLALKTAADARYTYSMNLNSLVLLLRDETASASVPTGKGEN